MDRPLNIVEVFVGTSGCSGCKSKMSGGAHHAAQQPAAAAAGPC